MTSPLHPEPGEAGAPTALDKLLMPISMGNYLSEKIRAEARVELAKLRREAAEAREKAIEECAKFIEARGPMESVTCYKFAAHLRSTLAAAPDRSG